MNNLWEQNLLENGEVEENWKRKDFNGEDGRSDGGLV